MVASEDRTGYWDRYYAGEATVNRPLPSQFATFVAGELGSRRRILEFGCGTGRDSIFFASYGHDVTGIDGSQEAVTRCRALAAELGEPVTFVAARVDDPELASLLQGPVGPLVIYARFFLHAISDDEECSFLDVAAELAAPGDLLAVEYRTVRDASGAKVTEQHYRRFVSPPTVQARALERGFDVDYAVEGFGYAKYQRDDAYVARDVFVKR